MGSGFMALSTAMDVTLDRCLLWCKLVGGWISRICVCLDAFFLCVCMNMRMGMCGMCGVPLAG